MRIVAMLGVIVVGLLAASFIPAASASALCSATANITKGSTSFLNYNWNASGTHDCIGFVDGTLTVTRTGAANVVKTCTGVLNCGTTATGSTLIFYCTKAKAVSGSILGSVTSAEKQVC